jgi:copper oxidase (laccase) domain-containing protein
MNSNNIIYACVGPCIGQKSYEVDLDFFEKFTNISSKNAKYFLKKNKKKKLFNLRKFVTDKLLKYKVKVDQVNKDTFSQKSNFFSYRRSTKLSEKDYGRCISAICMPELY